MVIAATCPAFGTTIAATIAATMGAVIAATGDVIGTALTILDTVASPAYSPIISRCLVPPVDASGIACGIAGGNVTLCATSFAAPGPHFRGALDATPLPSFAPAPARLRGPFIASCGAIDILAHRSQRRLLPYQPKCVLHDPDLRVPERATRSNASSDDHDAAPSLHGHRLAAVVRHSNFWRLFPHDC